MRTRYIKSLLIAVFGCFCIANAVAVSSIFSDYGQIQNVQNYSSNPFWTPNSPYNQRMPQPVYVQGADLNSEDCIKVVQSLVSVQCMARNNCKDTSLKDIKPVVMVQLSNLPGHNYISACSGYIDGIYESYISQYGDRLPTRPVDFPQATTPPDQTNETGIIPINNPYKPVVPKWQQEINERAKELQELQEQNSAGSINLSAVDFPATYEDLSFTERITQAAEGYKPYFNKPAYDIPNFVKDEKKKETVDVKEKQPDPVDVCVQPTAGAYIDDDSDIRYRFYSSSAEQNLIPSTLTNKTNNWLTVFPYGTMIGETDVDETPDSDGWYKCYCKILEYKENSSGKTYTGFSSIQNFSVRHYSNKEERLSACSEGCLTSITSNYYRRNEFFGSVFPHTNTDNCVYNYGCTFPDKTNPVSDLTFLKQTAIICAGRHPNRDLFVGHCDHDRNETCLDAPSQPGTWVSQFCYGKLGGESKCDDDGQCSCSLGFIGIFDAVVNQATRYDVMPDQFGESGNSKFTPINKFNSKSNCEAKCSYECSFAFDQEADNLYEYRKKLATDAQFTKIQP